MPEQDRAAVRTRTSRDVSRRALLIAAGAIVAGGVGSAVAVGREKNEGHAGPPRELNDAIAAEQQLIAMLDSAGPSSSTTRALIGQLRRDHSAHLDALQAQAKGYAVPGPAAAPAAVAGLDLAGLRKAEADAAVRAAARAAALSGRTATLLASIAACEASHAELLA